MHNYFFRRKAHKKKNTPRAGDSKNKDQSPSETTLVEKFEEKPQVEQNNVVPEKLIENAAESRAKKEKAESTKAKPTTTRTKPTKATKPKPKPPTKTKKPVNSNKVKTSENKNKPRAKGTLYGLSSLKRVGDVAVNIMSNRTMVKSKFAVGPLILRVEKEVRI